jgi:EpsI family protein
MKLDRGLNHFTYGWVVFAVVMAAFFAVGVSFRDHMPRGSTAPVSSAWRFRPMNAAAKWWWVGALAVAAVLLSLWPAYSSRVASQNASTDLVPITLPEPRGGWTLEQDASPRWRPAFAGAQSEAIGGYVRDGASVQCYLASYGRQSQGAELIHHRNVIVDPDNTLWRNLGERDREIQWQGGRLVVHETDVRSVGTRLLVWHWYWLPDEFTTSPGWAKVLRARATLLLHRDQAAVVVLSAPAPDDRNAEADLRRFVQDMIPPIRASLRRSSGF